MYAFWCTEFFQKYHDIRSVKAMFVLFLVFIFVQTPFLIMERINRDKQLTMIAANSFIRRVAERSSSEK